MTSSFQLWSHCTCQVQNNQTNGIFTQNAESKTSQKHFFLLNSSDAACITLTSTCRGHGFSKRVVPFCSRACMDSILVVHLPSAVQGRICCILLIVCNYWPCDGVLHKAFWASTKGGSCLFSCSCFSLGHDFLVFSPHGYKWEIMIDRFVIFPTCAWGSRNGSRDSDRHPRHHNLIPL